MSALSIFSKSDSSLGGYLSSINTEKGVFILTRAERFSLALNTRITTKNIRMSLKNFLQKSSSEIEKSLDNSIEFKINLELEKIIFNDFMKYM